MMIEQNQEQYNNTQILNAVRTVSGDDDIEPSFVLALMKKQGLSLSDLSRKHGLKPNSLRNAFYRSCPKYERIIADALHVCPSVIWSSRYNKGA